MHDTLLIVLAVLAPWALVLAVAMLMGYDVSVSFQRRYPRAPRHRLRRREDDDT